MHCTARLTACPFCMRGREEALASLQLSMAAPRWPALQEGGADRGTGRREAWALGLLVPREQDIAVEQEHVETGGAGDAGRRAGTRQRVRCKRSR